ncbi:hypothetical protein BO70DRAFT_150377 [Aspergillus heteromorphus CBS 117.55]|uniref:Gamma-glutamylcyclotransferase AIG2-like domain-containing protein n=1 Tax=Aspergillus heteromorphus CBS 117.55 TaxID=1448321 RepID=A0A317V8G5_9EURO|nr:uncharacterized protein BO70DRAFT_150377 [Aspergillus heteromorphus CBS 117.55]PWY69132.1 hypothetical protein BO70DRAFT_150377 [Aspergillus heteromorphus CBS 117.55]
MDPQPHYPMDYLCALHHTPTPTTLNTLLNATTSPPRFVYGVLKLPTALKYILDEPQSTDMVSRMTRATLAGYKLYLPSPHDPPVMLPSRDPGDAVEGMLIFGLNEEQRNVIYEFEAGLMELVGVKVRVEVFEGVEEDVVTRSEREVDAGAFAWKDGACEEGLVPVVGTNWEVDEFVAGAFYENMRRAQMARLLE